MSTTTPTTALALLALIQSTSAQYSNPYSGYNSGNNPYSGSTSGSGSSSSSGSNYGGFGGDLGFSSFSKATTLRLAHGVLASLAFVIFFPAGAISIRLINGKLALWMHVFFQVTAYLVYLAAFVIGVILARQFEFGSFKLISTYHPIIGIVLFAFLFFQPILGYIHHLAFKKHARRTIWSYAHLWLGRILITLGIINGGLGLMLANNSQSGEIAYGVVAGIVWCVWVAAAVYGEIKRLRKKKEGKGERVPGQGPPRYSAEYPAQQGREMRTNAARRSRSLNREGARPSQTPLMTESRRASQERRAGSPVREFYNDGNQRERSWV